MLREYSRTMSESLAQICGTTAEIHKVSRGIVFSWHTLLNPISTTSVVTWQVPRRAGTPACLDNQLSVRIFRRCATPSECPKDYSYSSARQTVTVWTMTGMRYHPTQKLNYCYVARVSRTQCNSKYR